MSEDAADPGVERIYVTRDGAGWTVRSSVLRAPSLFLSGGRAEAAARKLAQAFARNGVDAEVLVHDLRDLPVGTAIYYGLAEDLPAPALHETIRGASAAFRGA